MYYELGVLEVNYIWLFIFFFSGKIFISYRWVYNINQYSNVIIERFNVRLVVNGYTQQNGIDYYDIFFLTVNMIIVCCLLVLAVVQNWFFY